MNARILFIDPSTRAVGLTLIPHLVRNKAAPPVSCYKMSEKSLSELVSARS